MTDIAVRRSTSPAVRTSRDVVAFGSNPPGGPPPLPPPPPQPTRNALGATGTGIAVALAAGAGVSAAIDSPAWPALLATTVVVTAVTRGFGRSRS